MWNLFQKNGPVEVFTEYSYSQRFEKRYCLTIVALLLLQFNQLCFFVIVRLINVIVSIEAVVLHK